LMAEGYSNLHFIAGFAGLNGVARLYQRLTWEAIEKSNRTSTRIFVLLREAVILCANCEWEKAVEKFETGIQLADELRDTRQLEELTASLATCLLLQGQFERSLKLWKDYYERAVRKEGPQTQAWNLYGQGHNLIMLGRVEEALGNLKASLEIPMIDASDKILNVARSSALCLAYLRNGQFTEALAQVEQHHQITPAIPAISSFISEHSPVLDAIFGLMENHLSGINRLGEPELAQLTRSMQRIPKIVKALRKLPANVAGSWLYEGMYNHFNGKPKQAFTDWKKCLEFAEHNHQPYELGRAHYEIGRRLEFSDPMRAKHLACAVEIFERLNAPYELNLARTAYTP
jgi:tetratricopeptide (TPR) repeat protein